MFTLASGQQVYLTPARCKGARILAAHPKQNELSHVAEVKANASPIGATVLAYFVPNNVGFVSEAPRLHYGKAIG